MMQAPVITAALLVSPVLMVCLVFCLLAVLLMLILRGGGRKQKCARTRRHQRYRATAARVLVRLKTLPGDAHRLKYLRKINPYVFEELLLLADAPRDKRTYFREINYIAAAFQYQKKNYNSA